MIGLRAILARLANTRGDVQLWLRTMPLITRPGFSRSATSKSSSS